MILYISFESVAKDTSMSVTGNAMIAALKAGSSDGRNAT